MIFVSLGSGSSGNATLVSTGEESLLIDCGLSYRRIREGLDALGISMESLSGVLLTHEHADHIKGLKRLMSAHRIPVFGSLGTLESLAQASGDEYFRYAGRELLCPVGLCRPFEIGSFSVTGFPVYHDAAMPCAWRMELTQPETALSLTGNDNYVPRRQVSCCVLTDCGHFDDEICAWLKDLDLLLLEANHDRAMLSLGPYPMALKRRIMSSAGHLSNHAAGQLISEILNPRLRHVYLAHLSRENNTPAKAIETVRGEVAAACGQRAAETLSLSAAPRDGLSLITEL